MIISALLVLLAIACDIDFDDHKSAEELPSVPEISVSIETISSIGVSWALDYKATGYEVECYDSTNALLDSSKVGCSSSYTFTGLDKNKTYSFRARAVKNDKTTGWSEYKTCTLNEESVPFKISYVNLTSSGVTLSWPARSNAPCYYIVFSDCIGGHEKTINCGSNTSYTLTNLSQNVEYTFSVMWPYGNDDMYAIGGTLGLMTSAGTAYIDRPDNVNANTGGYSITVSWDAVSGARAYYVSIYDSSYRLIKTNSTTLTEVTFYSLSSDSTFHFSVRVYGTNGYYSAPSYMVSATTF